VNTAAPSTQPAFERLRGFRWTVCGLVFAATTINYMDRQVLGILAPTLEKALGWNELEYSRIVMAFQAAYALGLLGFGRVIDRIGTRHGYAISILAWSAAAMAHALGRGAWGFGVARFALGLGEAGNFPAAVKAVTEWFPRRERALATGVFNSGSNVGAILAPLVVPWLTPHYGWQMAFIALGATGFVWLLFWYGLYALPVGSPRVSPEELAYIHSGPPEPPVETIQWRKLLRYRQTWAFVVGMSFSARAHNVWIATLLIGLAASGHQGWAACSAPSPPWLSRSPLAPSGRRLAATGLSSSWRAPHICWPSASCKP
jgi:ACS family hexuronate transporter-like MFS transporter